MTDKGERLDRRNFEEYRNVQVEQGFVSSAEGSARVRLGGTEVVAGVKMDVGEPFPDTPDEGVLMVATEFVPLASPDFEAGPPREEAIEVSRVVDRAIRESKALDMKKLCLTPGEKVWMIYIDIDVLDNDGNLIDAAGIAAAAALLDARIPELENDKPVYTEKGYHKLQLNGIPLSATVAKVSNRMLVDPSFAEEMAAHARLTIGSVDRDNQVHLCSMQKGGPGGFSQKEIEEVIDIALRKAEEIRDMLKKL